jgi:hypothetical protein
MIRHTLRLLSFAVMLSLVLAACGDEGESLSVDVQTGLVPGPEFDRVETTLFSGAGGRFEPNEIDRIVVSDVRFPDRFERGRRVAEFGSVTPGTRSVRVRLYRPESAGGTVLIERWVRIRFTGSYALLVRLDRDCVGAMCPSPGGSAAFSECLAGRCVSPECDLDDPSTYAEHCCDPTAPGSDCPNILYCNDVEECAVSAPCAEVQCIEGACVESPIAGACDELEWCDPNPVRGGCRPAFPMSADAGTADAGVIDAGEGDAGEGDGSITDAGDVDAGAPDLGIDAGEPDLGFDAGPADMGFDAGEPDLGFDAGPIDAGFDAGTDAGPPPCYMEVCAIPNDPCRWGYIDCSLPTPACVPFVDRRGGTPCTTVGGASGVCVRGAECVACTPSATGALPPACTGATTDTDGNGIPDVEDTETCDGLDNDGDGRIDDGLAPAPVRRYADVDGDGYGDPAAPLPACATTGGVPNSGDCAPTNPRINPDAIEICGDDDNCNGLVDETPYTDALGFGGGSGTVADPYRICTPEHFRAITTLSPCGGAGPSIGRCLAPGSSFAQRRDIDFTSAGELPAPTTSFSGFYDGRGFLLRSPLLEAAPPSGVGVGLFGQSISGTIDNLVIEAATVASTGVVGGLGGFLTASGRIRNVTVSGIIDGDASVGGLIGQSDGGTIENATFEGDVTSSGAGPRVGTTFDSGVGGLVGVSFGGITRDSTADATVIWSDSGRAIPGWTFAGGAIGYMGGAGALTNTRFRGDVSGLLSVGGLVGTCEGGNRLESLSVDGSRVRGRENVGGLVGYNKCVTLGVWARADVTGATYVGGLEGTREAFATSTLTQAAAFGTVSGDNVVGGLVGRVTMRSGATAGGISDAYALTALAVSSGGAAGGLFGWYTSIGSAGAIVRRTYAAAKWAGGDVPGPNVGGWVGLLNPATVLNVRDSYFVLDPFRAAVGESGALDGVTGLVIDESVLRESYVGFDFVDVWRPVAARDGDDRLTPALAFECDVTAICR